MTKHDSSEFNNFDRTMRKLMRVPHSELKAKLDAEKQTKKRKKSRKASASRVANDRA
jgi:hypothetical protein